MTNVDEKKSKKKPVNSSEISSLIHTPPSDHSTHNASSTTKEASSHHSYEANINDINKRHTNEATIESSKHSKVGGTGNIGLEDIFPINPEIVHSAQLNLAVEQEAAAKKQESFASFTATPTSFFFDFTSTFWRFFWHDFNHQLQNIHQNTNQSTSFKNS
ncbi:MAG: hypothetical protein V4525_15235 [Pseudomonadota bacterium]